MADFAPTGLRLPFSRRSKIICCLSVNSVDWCNGGWLRSGCRLHVGKRTTPEMATPARTRAHYSFRRDSGDESLRRPARLENTVKHGVHCLILSERHKVPGFTALFDVQKG